MKWVKKSSYNTFRNAIAKKIFTQGLSVYTMALFSKQLTLQGIMILSFN